MKLSIRIISFFWFPFAVLLAHVVAANVLHLYSIFPNLDIPFHYVGGLSIAYSTAKILRHLEIQWALPHPLNKVIFLVLLFSITATATVFWEFAEFIADQILHINIQISLANTMQDQLMGILGGMTWMYIWMQKAIRTRLVEGL